MKASEAWEVARRIEEAIAAAWAACSQDAPRLEALAAVASPQLVRQFVEVGRRDRIWRAPDGVTISASALGGCSRSLAFELEGVPRDPVDAPRISPSLRGRFALGDAVEALVCLALEASGVRLAGACTSAGRQEEVSAPLAERAWVLGHPDGRARVSGVGEVLIEVKSCDPAVFAAWCGRAEGGGQVFGPHDRCWWQVQGYLRGAGLDLCLLFALDRASGELRVFPILADAGEWERLGALYLAALRRRRRVTPAGEDLDPRRGLGECAVCPWRAACLAEAARPCPVVVASQVAPSEDHGRRVCSCGRPVEWILTAKNGRAAPVELERVAIVPRKAGALSGYTDSGELIRGDYPEPGEKGARTVRLAHFARCPDAGRHRRGK